VVELELSDGEVEPVAPPVVELLVPAPAPESVGVLTCPAAPPEVFVLVDGAVVEGEGVADVLMSDEPVAPVDPLVDAPMLLDVAALALVPVDAAMFWPDHQSRDARSLGEAAMYWSSMA